MPNLTYVDPLLTIHALQKHGISVHKIPLNGIYPDHYDTMEASKEIPSIPVRVSNPYPTPEAAFDIWGAWEKDRDRTYAPQRERERTHTEAEARWLEYINSLGPYPLQKHIDGKQEWIAGWRAGRRDA